MTSSPSGTTGPSIHLNQSISSTSKQRTIDQQLADTRQAQQKRRHEIESSMTRSSTLVGRMYKAVKTDHNTARLSLICVSLVCSLFGSLLLAIAGDPPYHEGAIYQYNDLMRLVSQIHDKSFEVTPNLSEKSWKEEMQNASSTEDSNSRITRLLREWWPIKRIDFESNDAILNDHNFYSRNYRTFQTAFIVLMVFGDLILLLSWLYFLAAKELKIYQYKNRQSDKFMNGSSSPKTVAESTNELIERIKRFFKGKQLRKLKRSWLDDAPRRPWQKRSFVLVVSAIGMHSILFCILTSRPNMFALVLHQVVFVCLAVICLASTEVHPPEQDTSKSSQESRSLRGSNNNRIHFQSPTLSGVVESSASPVNGHTNKSIFVTEQSVKASSSGTQVQYPPNNNPFEEEIQGKAQSILNATTNEVIDDEVEKEVEQV